MKAAAGAASTEDRDRDPGRVVTDAWVLVYEGAAPGHEGHREALCTLANGYLATRGAAPESATTGRTIRGPTWPASTTG